MRLLRLSTAGSVDDGKSTLIGRLLLDSSAVHDDQLAALRRASQRRGISGLDLALLTDGLKAEREQGITIDVAYRYFATARRKFIVADCPGHLQYTRNMVTGTSTADAAVIVIDVTKGLQEQTRRHSYVASLLRVPHLVMCVNKMDLVGYAEEPYRAAARALDELASRLSIPDAIAIPMSALAGENIVAPSTRMPWYAGLCLLEHLEGLEPRAEARAQPLRLPVQGTILGPDFRGYAGSIAAGALGPEDQVLLLPSGRRTRLAGLELGGRPLERAEAPHSVTFRLAEELDVQRGDMLVHPDSPARVAEELDAVVCWLGEPALETGGRYLLRLGCAETPAVVESVDLKIDVNTLSETPAAGVVGLNEFARVRLRCARPVAYDPYRQSRATGGCILIDETTLSTVGAGMLM